MTVGRQVSRLTEHVPQLPGCSMSVLGNRAGTKAPVDAPIPSLQLEPAPSVLLQGQGTWAAADFPSSASLPPMASEDPFSQRNLSLRMLSNIASAETHAPASAPSLSSCASRPHIPSQDSESQQLPMAAVKPKMSKAESHRNATQRLEHDELETIQGFQRKHDIVLSRCGLKLWLICCAVWMCYPSGQPARAKARCSSVWPIYYKGW